MIDLLKMNSPERMLKTAAFSLANPGAPRRAFPQARPQTSRNRRRDSFHPPSPSCQDSSFPIWGTSRIFCEPRTTLGHWRVLPRLGREGDKVGVFSIRYSE